MKSAFRLGLVAAAVPVLSGCFYFPGTFGASGGGSADAAAAQANVRGAIPAIEAYYADNNTYAGVSLETLQEYDYGVKDIRVVTANDQTYCLESGVGGETYSKAGPGADILPGYCPDLTASPPLTLPEPAQTLHAAARTMENYRLAHGSYEGMTTRDLRAFGVEGVTVAQATAKSYCLEKTVADARWIARESGDVGIGAC